MHVELYDEEHEEDVNVNMNRVWSLKMYRFDVFVILIGTHGYLFSYLYTSVFVKHFLLTVRKGAI